MDEIRTIIVDDEPIARRGLRSMLASEPDMICAGEAGDGVQAIELIEAESPDLVLLDIQMPELDGFEVVAHLDKGRLPVIVFVTAYDAFALEAFRVHAVDYLLKPVKAGAFAAAVERARAMLQYRQLKSFERRVTDLLDHFKSQQRFQHRLLVKSRGKVLVIEVDSIDRCEAAGDYVRIFCGKSDYLLRTGLGELESKLDPRKFVRIHRSAIVRIDCIRVLQPLTNGDYAVTLHDGTNLTLSRSFRERAFDSLS